MYRREREMRSDEPLVSNVMNRPTAEPQIVISPPTTTAPTTADALDSLVQKFSELSINLTSAIDRLVSPKPAMTAAPTAAPTATPLMNPRPFRPPRCVWCDTTEHTRADCFDLAVAIRDGLVKRNESGRLIDARTGNELPTMFGKGGMKVLFAAMLAAAPVPTSVVSAITLEPPLARLGHTDTIFRTTIDFETGERMEEIIDVSVEPKRARGHEKDTRNTRQRLDYPPPVTVEDVPDEAMTGMPPPVSQPTPAATQPEPPTPETTKTKPPSKFRLASDLSEQLPVDVGGGKMLDAPVQLTFREVLSVSNELAGYIHDQTRRKRIPLDTTQTKSSTAGTTSANHATVASVTQNEWEKTYYALPSGRAVATIAEKTRVSALLDTGSEVNLIPKRIFDTLDYPIDTDIRWRISGYDQKTQDHLRGSGAFGVLHDCPIEIGGITVRLHLFVVQDAAPDLLLGRPFERATRATYINEDDGSMVVILKSQDGRREVSFVAVKGQHERNREFVREESIFRTSANSVTATEERDLKW